MEENKSCRAYFDLQAETWDNYDPDTVYPVIVRILDRFGLEPGGSVLDVACGTGILTPFLRDRRIGELVATDVSGGMCRVFASKFPGEKIVRADFETALFNPSCFDAVLIFNAFAHFANPAAVFDNAFHALKPGGRLLVAHSMNRAALDGHHRRAGREVAGHVLVSDREMAEFYRAAGFTDIIVEDAAYFYSEGRRPAADIL
ncbi:MAG: class I SAM-dependent methyltransferase [Elusimicrobiaceae bacterium]|nr:class I SAM-dependent methyltransferase [Elusimicrobiaceae bacterium]